MIKKRSIYQQFQQKLIVATSIFIILLSFIFYVQTKNTILNGIKERLLADARLIKKINENHIFQDAQFNVITLGDVTVDIVTVENLKNIQYKVFRNKKTNYMQILYPFNLKNKEFISITKNINTSLLTINRIFNNIIILSFSGLILVILYAFTVSKALLNPIIYITSNLSKMNENFLTKIDKDSLPVEFHPLANSINILTHKIENFVKFKKELFIGAAHELKTPLAVIKLKNEVTLMKKRDCEKYEETLKLTISQINEMNKMLSSILDMGRAEGAQFEEPVELDIIQFLKTNISNYSLLTKEKDIKIFLNTKVLSFNTIIQQTLLTHIIQNFVQNAIKFTPNGKKIDIDVYQNKKILIIKVIDEGVGIDENIDLFAPFKRIGNESGVGLGLFLAKNAADSLGAIITLKNRPAKNGTIATLILSSNPIIELQT